MCVSVTPIELTMNDDSYSRYDSWQKCRVFKSDSMQDSNPPIWLYHTIKSTMFDQDKEKYSKSKVSLMPKKSRVLARRVSMELDISQTGIRRIMKNHLELRPYKVVIAALLSDDQKIRRKKFANWVRTSFRKQDTMRILEVPKIIDPSVPDPRKYILYFQNASICIMYIFDG